MTGPLDRLLRRRERAPDAPADATTELPAIDGQREAATAMIPAVGADDGPAVAAAGPGFQERGKLRRRLRYVRRAREIALRDLGGLAFDLHRFGRERSDLIEQKLTSLGALDGEMRELEVALDDVRDLTVLREPGLATCPRCGALHASDAGFCSACGLPVSHAARLPAGTPAAQPPPGAGQTLTVVPGKSESDGPPS